jgi:multimeric flavodoxin WrbA
MRVVGVNASPNEDGLTATVLQHALEGAGAAGADTHTVHLKRFTLEACRQCESGWGICRSEGVCVIEDDFEQVREELHAAQALVISTPVYFSDVSEVFKTFFDRLRRCRFAGQEHSPLAGMPVLGIAAAGGSGGGTVNCVRSLEHYFGHLGFKPFDYLPIMRRSREYQLQAARAAGEAMVRWTEEQQT